MAIERTKYIGSTDVAAIAGVSKYRNPLQVFNSKLGIETNSSNNAMKWGLKLEDIILKEIEECCNVKIAKKQVFAQHEVYKFLGGTADAVTDCGTLLEAKTSRVGSGFNQNEVPDDYMIQVQWLLGLNGLKKAILGVLIGLGDFRTYTIYFDENLYSKLVKICVNFWERNVLQCVPPDVVSKINKELPSDVFIVYQRIKRIQEVINEKQNELDELKEQFCQLTSGQNEVLNDGRLIAKKSVGFREVLDKKELSKHVELDKFTKKTEYTTIRFY